MTKQEQIEEMTKERNEIKDIMKLLDKCVSLNPMYKSEVASVLYGNNYRKLPKDSVVLSREEYEMLKSLYDTQKGAIMTSSIGDLPLTVEGLRKAVDEITRLNRVETELQELTAKYYNEAKDLRRELKQTRKETAKVILNVLYFNLQSSVKGNFAKSNDYYNAMGWIQKIAKNYGVEVEE